MRPAMVKQASFGPSWRQRLVWMKLTSAVPLGWWNKWDQMSNPAVVWKTSSTNVGLMSSEKQRQQVGIYIFFLFRYTYSKLFKICLTNEQLLPCFSNAHAHIYNVLSSRNLQEGNAAFCPSAVWFHKSIDICWWYWCEYVLNTWIESYSGIYSLKMFIESIFTTIRLFWVR